MKILLENNIDYCAAFLNYYKNHKNIDKIEISKDVVFTHNFSLFNDFHLNGKILKCTTKNNDIIAFVDIYGKIVMKLVEKNSIELDINMEEFSLPMRMQLAEEEHMCNCGNKFYGKKLKCEYCGKNLIYF